MPWRLRPGATPQRRLPIDGGRYWAPRLDPRRAAADRDRLAAGRDEKARRRDAASAARDRIADARDRAAGTAAPLGAPDTSGSLEDAKRIALEERAHAASDRARAAQDRVLAATDRKEAAIDREELRSELEAAHLDDLTGAYLRGVGGAILGNEIQRAQRAEAALTLAVIDVDGLKEVNDGRGHAAGDALLRDVVGSLRSKLRPYDPIVRTGGDEFVCTLGGVDLATSRERMAAVSSALAVARPGASISVGLVEMGPEDSAGALVERGDSALYAAKRA